MKPHKLLLALPLLLNLAVIGYGQSAALQAADKPLPMTDVTFKDVDAKEAIKNLGRNLNLNVVFDESVRIQGKLELELRAVTLEATLKIIFIQQRLRACWVEDNTIYVYADTPQNRQRFDEYKVWAPRANPGK